MQLRPNSKALASTWLLIPLPSGNGKATIILPMLSLTTPPPPQLPLAQLPSLIIFTQRKVTGFKKSFTKRRGSLSYGI